MRDATGPTTAQCAEVARLAMYRAHLAQPERRGRRPRLGRTARENAARAALEHTACPDSGECADLAARRRTGAEWWAAWEWS